MDYEIRWTKEDDSDDLGNIHSAAWRVAYKGIIPEEVLESFTPESRRARFKNAIINKTEETAVLLTNKQIVGFVTLGKCRDEDAVPSYGEIWGIYLHPDHWRKGIGSRLINWALDELRSRNFEKVTLWVLKENIKACMFYEKHGFETDGVSKAINIGREIKEIRYIKEI